MGRGLISIALGTVMVFGGLSGGMVLRGTSSAGALAAIGGVVIAIGVFRIVQSRGGASGPPKDP